MLKHLKRRWFLLALAAVLLIGYTQASRLSGLADAVWLRNGIVATVMFLMSLPLGTATMVRALRNPVPAMLAVVMNFGVVPLLAWGCSIPVGMLSREMANGILVAGATPCTLASAAVWTRRAGGNDAVALMVTIITNLACFVVTPFWLLTTTGQTMDLSFTSLATKLALLVVVPIFAAQFLRLYAPLATWASREKAVLGSGAQVGILAMVLLAAIGAGLKLGGDLTLLVGWGKAAMVVAVMAIHLGALFGGMATAQLLRQSREDAIAVGIAGSQKTLMTGLLMATTLFPNSLAMLPMIVYHAGQLLADTVIADRLRKDEKKR